MFLIEAKLAFAVHVEQVVHEAQPLPSVQDAGGRAKAAEVVENIVLQMVQPGFRLPHGRRLDTEGQVFRFGQAVVALGQLGLQHLAVLGPDIVETIFLGRDADAMLKTLGVGGHIHKGKFKVHRRIEEIQKAAPLLENGRLVLLQCQLVIDVLELDGAGIIAVPHPAGAVGKHPLKGDGLLGSAGDAVIAAGRFHDAVNLLALGLAEQGLTGGLFAAGLFEQCASPPPGRLPAA